MLDANETLNQEASFKEFLSACDLHDLHHSSPAPLTYIGSSICQIDLIFGSLTAKETLLRSGTLSYIKRPQSDHRGLFVDLDTRLLGLLTHSRI